MMMKHTSRKETAGAAANMKLCIPSVPSSNLPYFLKPSLPSLFRPVIFPFLKLYSFFLFSSFFRILSFLPYLLSAFILPLNFLIPSFLFPFFKTSSLHSFIPSFHSSFLHSFFHLVPCFFLSFVCSSIHSCFPCLMHFISFFMSFSISLVRSC